MGEHTARAAGRPVKKHPSPGLVRSVAQTGFLRGLLSKLCHFPCAHALRKKDRTNKTLFCEFYSQKHFHNKLCKAHAGKLLSCSQLHVKIYKNIQLCHQCQGLVCQIHNVPKQNKNTNITCRFVFSCNSDNSFCCLVIQGWTLCQGGRGHIWVWPCSRVTKTSLHHKAHGAGSITRGRTGPWIHPQR